MVLLYHDHRRISTRELKGKLPLSEWFSGVKNGICPSVCPWGKGKLRMIVSLKEEVQRTKKNPYKPYISGLVGVLLSDWGLAKVSLQKTLKGFPMSRFNTIPLLNKEKTSFFFLKFSKSDIVSGEKMTHPQICPLVFPWGDRVIVGGGGSHRTTPSLWYCRICRNCGCLLVWRD